jgi:hypothetical protein
MKTIKQFLLNNAGPIFFTIAMSIGLFLMGLLLGAIDQWLLPDKYRKESNHERRP